MQNPDTRWYVVVSALGLVAIVWCLFDGIADREKPGAPLVPSGRPSSKRTSSQARAVSPDLGMTVQQEIDAAKQDPLIQQRLADFMRELDEDPANANDPINPGWPYQRKEADDLVALYAIRYPLAGLEWIFAFNDPRFHPQSLLVSFVMELQESKPGVAMKLLEQMDSSERKGKFAELLAWHVHAGEIDHLWKYLLDPSNHVGDEGKLREVKRQLIGAEARIDPDSAWERFRTQFPESGDEREFLQVPWGCLDAGALFPVRFLDRIVAGGHEVAPSVTSAIWHGTSPQNIAPIEAWLEQNHGGFDPKPAFKEMGQWWQAREKNPSAAEFWYSRAK